MQLDKTEIVIRQRSMSELMDLSLVVLRRHGLKIAAASAVFGLPLMLLNLFAIQWMLGEEVVLATEDMEGSDLILQWRHTLHFVGLFLVQFPLATLPATLFLGNQIFFEHLTLKQLLLKLRSIAWPAFWVLGVVRLGLVMLVLEFFVNRSTLFDPLIEVSLILGLLIVLLVRGVWPFAPEILGLELCPLRAKPGSPITYSQRRSGLHQSVSSDQMSRFFGCSLASIMLAAILVAAAYTLVSTLTGRAQWSVWYSLILLPLMLWITGLFVVVFRFLSYLDSRIRLEGWELELRLRAEGQRVASSMAPAVPDPLINPERVVS